jgi:hypothetical protein
MYSSMWLGEDESGEDVSLTVLKEYGGPPPGSKSEDLALALRTFGLTPSTALTPNISNYLSFLVNIGQYILVHSSPHPTHSLSRAPVQSKIG